MLRIDKGIPIVELVNLGTPIGDFGIICQTIREVSEGDPYMETEHTMLIDVLEVSINISQDGLIEAIKETFESTGKCECGMNCSCRTYKVDTIKATGESGVFKVKMKSTLIEPRYL